MYRIKRKWSWSSTLNDYELFALQANFIYHFISLLTFHSLFFREFDLNWLWFCRVYTYICHIFITNYNFHETEWISCLYTLLTGRDRFINCVSVNWWKDFVAMACIWLKRKLFNMPVIAAFLQNISIYNWGYAHNN